MRGRRGGVRDCLSVRSFLGRGRGWWLSAACDGQFEIWLFPGSEMPSNYRTRVLEDPAGT